MRTDAQIIPRARLTPGQRAKLGIAVTDMAGLMEVEHLPPAAVRKGITPRCYECGVPMSARREKTLVRRLCRHCRELPKRIAALRRKGML